MLISTSKFDSRIVRVVRQREITLLLVNNLHEKRISKSQNGQNFVARALFVICTRVTTLHSCYNFALVFMKIALVSSQSEAHNFFLYSIIIEGNL